MVMEWVMALARVTKRNSLRSRLSLRCIAVRFWRQTGQHAVSATSRWIIPTNPLRNQLSHALRPPRVAALVSWSARTVSHSTFGYCTAILPQARIFSWYNRTFNTSFSNANSDLTGENVWETPRWEGNAVPMHSNYALAENNTKIITIWVWRVFTLKCLLAQIWRRENFDFQIPIHWKCARGKFRQTHGRGPTLCCTHRVLGR
eukprot:COSAG02_NODE_21656_length_780_cov_0.716593_1_plen_202_part_01